MDGSTLLHAATIHSSFLAHTGVEPIRARDLLILPTAPEAFAHARWLLNEVPGFIAQGRLEKAQRWTCFVQGVLWDRGLTTTRFLKDAMRPPGSVYDECV